MRNPTTGARRYQPIGHLLAQKRHWPRGSGTAACHPQRASKQLPPQLGERLLSSDGQAPWNDSHGEGFRMPAITGLASGHGVGVRKPPMHEPAGLRRWSMGI
jgi:hypothetical protein